MNFPFHTKHFKKNIIIYSKLGTLIFITFFNLLSKIGKHCPILLLRNLVPGVDQSHFHFVQSSVSGCWDLLIYNESSWVFHSIEINRAWNRNVFPPKTSDCHLVSIIGTQFCYKRWKRWFNTAPLSNLQFSSINTSGVSPVSQILAQWPVKVFVSISETFGFSRSTMKVCTANIATKKAYPPSDDLVDRFFLSARFQVLFAQWDKFR